MAGTKEGAQKRLTTLHIKAMMNNENLSDSFSKWGKKGGNITTGGFHNMDKDKLAEASAKGVKTREKNRGETKN